MKSALKIFCLFTIPVMLFFMLSPRAFVHAQEETGTMMPDAFTRPPEVQAEIAAAEEVQALGLPGYYDTSVFMTGKVAIGIIMPESAGGLENWTTDQRTNVINEIQDGMNWWKAQGGAGANLTFSYDIQYGIPTSYEPITMSTGEENVWITNVMNNMGYTSGSYFSRVYAYINHIRTQYSTDWAFAIFVVDDESIPVHKFADGYFAYAYLGGPFMVMTYNNDGWGWDDMDRVTAHEAGHIFLAGDQYASSNCSKTARYGYLGIVNSNCDYGTPTGIPSIMKGNDLVLDVTAHDQVGWRDSDSDGIPDPLDNVTINLNAHTPNPTAETTLTYNGSAQISAYPHAVCTGINDVCYDRDINLPQVISNVQYRTDSGAWSNATPGDGAFNSDTENFSFTVPMGNGTHVFDARVTGSLGAAKTWSDTVNSTTPLGAGKYDDTNPSWSYTGGWTTYSGTGPYQDTIHYTGTVGASAYFRFTGQQFILTYTASNNRGSFEVWVDDAKAATINAYNATLVWQRTYISPTYSSGTHTVMVKNIGGGTYVDVDAIHIDPDPYSPSGVSSLVANTGTSAGSVDLSWTAPMNDAGNPASGPVGSYLVRYSLTNIVTEADWNAATPVTSGIPTPGAVGANQAMTVTGLAPGMLYYICVRGQDSLPNLGPIVTASAMPKAPAPMGVGIYDDANPAWTYTGTWSTYSGTGPYAGTLHYTDAVDAMGSFTFTGLQFVLTYTGEFNRGSFEVWVDGSLVTTLNAYSASTAWQRKYISPVYAAGNHTVVVRKIGSGRMDIDAIQVVDYVGVGTYDDMHAGWVYAGTWNTYSGSGPASGTLHYTDMVDATATFMFTGIQFILTYTGDSNRGSFEVWVDGSLVTTVNAYNASIVWQKMYASPIYPADRHTVTIKKIGSGWADVDAIRVIAVPDTVAPGPVSNLSAAPGTSGGSVDLNWATPLNDAGDPASGPVISYLVRYSLTNIVSTSDWNAATPVTGGLPTPGAAGTGQAMTVSGLVPGLGYYFAVRGQDTTPNLGPIVTTYAVVKAPARMGAGVFDNAHSSWTYTGSWNTYSGSGPYAGTLHYTDSSASTASFVFTGTQFILTYTGEFNRGSFEVWVDGSLVTTVNAYNATTAWQRKYTSPVYAAGDHTVMVKSAGSGRIDVDAIQIIGPVGAGMYDDAHVGWMYTGTWSTYAGPGPYANTLHYTDATGAEASFLFTGVQFVLTYTGEFNRGSFEVWVDGAKVTTVNAYSATTAWRQKYVSPVYSSGTHTVVFKRISGRTDIDAIQVIEGMGPGIYDDANSAWIYSGTWNTYSGSGPYANTLHYTDAASAAGTFIFTGTQFILTYTGEFNRGSFEVWVDGSLVTTVNAYSATTAWQRKYTSPVYAAGTHMVMFKNVSGRTDIDAIQVISPLGPGTYDNAHSAWTYTGTWSTYAGSGPYANTLHYTDATGAEASFLFTGVQFVLTYTGEFNRGSFEVWVDGAKVTTVNAYSATTAWRQKYVSPVYSSGTHTVVFKRISGRTDIDAIQVIDRLGSGVYDGAHGSWYYTGIWNTYAGSGPYAGTLQYTDITNATATCTFTGTQFAFIYTGEFNRGSFEVWVDGSLVTTVNAYSATTAWQRTYLSPIYASGTHTVMIKEVSGRIDVDAIRIWP